MDVDNVVAKTQKATVEAKENLESARVGADGKNHLLQVVDLIMKLAESQHSSTLALLVSHRAQLDSRIFAAASFIGWCELLI